MVATISPYRKKRLPVKAKDIPHYLIYEIMDGKPIYYEGFREVLSNKKTFEEIMGSSRLQSRIIAVIVKDLNIRLSDDFEALSNEFGIHLDHKNNLCGDIGIFESSLFSDTMDEDKYFDIPPKIVIEIDTKAAFEFIDEGGYYHKKTQKLLDFGVEKVIWFYTKSQKVMIAQKEKSWTIDDWNKNIEVMPDLDLCLTDLMAKKGITV
jgi:Uma2 family endonuclease